MNERFKVRWKFNGVISRESPPMSRDDAECVARRIRTRLKWDAEVIEADDSELSASNTAKTVAP